MTGSLLGTGQPARFLGLGQPLTKRTDSDTWFVFFLPWFVEQIADNLGATVDFLTVNARQVGVQSEGFGLVGGGVVVMVVHSETTKVDCLFDRVSIDSQLFHIGSLWLLLNRAVRYSAPAMIACAQARAAWNA
ncbi:hypothetical protein RN02_03195 [Pseudomonas sp. PI1]|nr:hypothetical protein RN02_03195 [Pseudomonas sp. PI1]